MKNKLLILSCCALLLVTTGCGKSIPKTKNGEEIVASIDGKDFTADELYAELKTENGYNKLINMIDNYIADKEVETTEDLKKNAQQYVDFYKQYAEMYQIDLGTFLEATASETGITGVTTEEELLEFFIKDLKIKEAIRKQIENTLTDKEIEKYYNENYSERLTVRHILIKPEESDKDGKKALEQANKLIDELKKTKKDKLEDKFIELAKEYSDDGTSTNGGLYENFMSGTVVKEFWEGSSKLKDGEYTTTPVKTTYGYHIILRKSKSDKPSLEESKDDIKEAIVNDKMTNDSVAQYTAMKELREKYKLSINDSDIKDSYDDFLKDLKEAVSILGRAEEKS